MDLEIYKFRKSISDYVNGIELPAEVKRMCLGEILKDLECEASREIMRQAKEEDKMKKDGGEKDEQSVSEN